MPAKNLPKSKPIPTLSQEELQRLSQALTAVWAVPFVEDLNGALWETIFHYIKGLPIPDRLVPVVKMLKSGKPSRARRYKGTKRLFDAVDNKSHTGWSLKVKEWGSLAPGTTLEFIIQRAHISKQPKKTKRSKESGDQMLIPEIHVEVAVENSADTAVIETISLNSPEEVLGRELTKYWNSKVTGDMKEQGVLVPRLGLLIKSTDRKDYIFIEQEIPPFDPDKLTWSWADEKKAGLQATHSDTKQVVLKWYHSQKQLFQTLTIPAGATSIHIEPKRLTPDQFISGIIALTRA